MTSPPEPTWAEVDRLMAELGISTIASPSEVVRLKAVRRLIVLALQEWLNDPELRTEAGWAELADFAIGFTDDL